MKPLNPKVLRRTPNSISLAPFPVQLPRDAGRQPATFAAYCKASAAGVSLTANKTSTEYPGGCELALVLGVGCGCAGVHMCVRPKAVAGTASICVECMCSTQHLPNMASTVVAYCLLLCYASGSGVQVPIDGRITIKGLQGGGAYNFAVSGEHHCCALLPIKFLGRPARMCVRALHSACTWSVSPI